MEEYYGLKANILRTFLTKPILLESSHFNAPMALKPQPTPHDLNKFAVKEYRSLVVALQYLTHTQPNIAHTVVNISKIK